jgi:hypothetical protein
MPDYVDGMFIRVRWFLFGVIVSVVAGMMVIKRARAMKQRLDAEGVVRIIASYGADVVETLGTALQRSANRQEPESATGSTEPDA